jgi:hypothetical protein
MFVLCLEVGEVVLVQGVLLRLLILSQLGIVVVFHRLAPAFVRRLLVRCEDLPSLTDCLGDFCEAEIFALQVLSDFCDDGQLCSTCTVLLGNTYG